MSDTDKLALDAAMAVVDRYGGLWSGDADILRAQLRHVIYAAMELGSDAGPDAWDEAKRTLTRLLTEDIHDGNTE